MRERAFTRSTVVLASIIVALAAWPAPAAADVLISNHPGNDGTYTSLNGAGGSIDSKAVGFTMPAGTDYFLDQVTLRMRITDPANDPYVAIWSDVGGSPTSELIVLTNPTFTAGIIGDYVFTPPSQFTLVASQTYWVMVYNQSAGADSVHWMASSPGQAPSGSASHVGYLFSFTLPPPTGTSSTFNTYILEGTLVPVELMTFTVE
jgi:hypothetical protein